jgi:dTDP-4-amino-4,6-dideoxygalactose transaminase
MIPFNKPFIVGKELDYIAQAVASGKISGNGPFTKRCQQFFEEQFGYTKCLLTTSGTDALEMAAILADIQPGDEVIMPSFTFVSTALAFVRQGATIIFADSCKDNPNLDAEQIESLITPRTRALVPVHYAGVACDMGKIMAVATKHNLLVIADAAHAIDAYYTGELPATQHPWQKRLRKQDGRLPLGGIGHLGCFSFHETKNIQCGEGGMLTINDPRFSRRAEVIWEKGTNRAEFFRGEVSKYEWVDVGSSFLPSGITAAFLWAQLEELRKIQEQRTLLWEVYFEGLAPLASKGYVALPQIPPYATNNAHMFYLLCKSREERGRLIENLLQKGIQTATHYQSLHDSSYYKAKYQGPPLVNCKRYVNCLLRLPLFYGLELSQVRMIVSAIKRFYEVSVSFSSRTERD